MTWRAALVSPAGGSRSALRVALVDAVGDVAGGAAQRGFDALRHGREIGLAVERRENGAAHEGRAAKTGQDRAAEPLDRDAAAIDQIARLAVDRQRRLRCRDRCARPPRSHEMRRVACPDPSPTSPPPASAGGSRTPKVPNATGRPALTRGRSNMPRPSRSVNDRVRIVLALSVGNAVASRIAVTDDVSSPRTDTSPDVQVGRRNVAAVRRPGRFPAGLSP